MKTEILTSAQNPKIRTLLALQEKSRSRREAGLFVVEGRREIGHCLEAGCLPRALFVCEEILAAPQREALLARAEARNPACSLFLIPAELYRKAARRESTEGILAEIEYREHTLQDLRLSDNPLLVVLESVEKPGNLGAVLRSADAAGADAVIVCDPLTDLCNPNLIRSSMGGIFTVQTAAASSEEAIAWLRAHSIRIVTAQLQDATPYWDASLSGGIALVLGAETAGLSPRWREAADARLRIPMHGRLDSLNVSVAAAILLFEAVRQRRPEP